MGLGDVTAEGVKRSMAEFDRLGGEAFRKKYGFGRARRYFLISGGRRYDSKAVFGVAHKYSRSDLNVLRSQDFSGGDDTVAHRLELLGFDVERLPPDPPWAEEELVLALDLYLRLGALGKAHPDVEELSGVLKALTIHSERPDPDRFRNPNGVAMKLANFAALDPNYAGRGMTRLGGLDVEVWKRYSSDEDMLAEAAKAIRQGRELPATQPDEPGLPQVIEVEAHHVEEFRVSVPGQDRVATRSEQGLVQDYKDHLRDQGHEVTRHRYPLPESGSALYCDLVDETHHVLYEAKGDALRNSVRMAVGQLLDYRRFEETPKRLAVLLPRKPHPDLIKLIHSVPASVVWRADAGFADPCHPPSISHEDTDEDVISQ